MLLSEKEAKTICEKLLGSVTAEDAVVSINSEDSSHLRFAANAFTTSGRSENTTVRVTTWIGKKRGETATNELDDASLRAAVEQAEQLARIAPSDREYLPTLGPQTYKPVNGYVEATSNIPVVARAKIIHDVIAACEKSNVVGAGFHEAHASARARATKNGNFDYQRWSLVGLSLTARTSDGGGSGYFQRNHFDVAKLDTTRIAREAIQKALDSRNARTLEPGAYPVILEPQAVADLLSSSRSTSMRAAPTKAAALSRRPAAKRASAKRFSTSASNSIVIPGTRTCRVLRRPRMEFRRRKFIWSAMAWWRT